MRTPERIELARELREDGKTYVEAGALLGVSHQTVHAWLTDPDGTAREARRATYRGVCEDCGTATSGAGGRKQSAPPRCRTCAGAHIRKLSREWVIASIRDWVQLFGAPPSAQDWNQAMARRNGRTDLVDRYEQTGREWPSTTLAQDNFGSWNAALAAAGVETLGSGERRDQAAHAAKIRAIYGTQQRRETIAAGWHAGLTGPQIAARLGVQPSTVFGHVCKMRRAGWDLPYRNPGRRAA